VQTTPDWDALAADPEFVALHRARRRFVIPATIFFILFYLALPISVGFAPHAMSRPVLGPLTLAFAFAFLQFVVAWVLLALYMRVAKYFDRQASRIIERARPEKTQ
jgi:uncharacterized membrane protein (DUF485 family)